MQEVKKIIKARQVVHGFGSQYLNKASALAYARSRNYTYRNTPFAKGHGLSGEIYDEFVGMKSDEDDNAEAESSEVEENAFWWNKVKIGGFTEEVRDELRSMYFSTPKPEACQYDIAIHIRRGDIRSMRDNHNSRMRHCFIQRARWISDRRYIKYIKLLKERYPDYSICIYSEGPMEWFEAFKFENVFFNIPPVSHVLDEGKTLKEAFHQMVTAKVLLAAPSGFSLSASILSKGTIYYIPVIKQFSSFSMMYTSLFDRVAVPCRSIITDEIILPNGDENNI